MSQSKNSLPQEKNRSAGIVSRSGMYRRSSGNSSSRRACGGQATFGRRAQMMDSGITMDRVQADMAWMLKGNQLGKSIRSGGMDGTPSQS